MAGLEREPVGQVGLAEGAGIALDLQRQLQRQLAEMLAKKDPELAEAYGF